MIDKQNMNNTYYIKNEMSKIFEDVSDKLSKSIIKLKFKYINHDNKTIIINYEQSQKAQIQNFFSQNDNCPLISEIQ